MPLRRDGLRVLGNPRLDREGLCGLPKTQVSQRSWRPAARDADVGSYAAALARQAQDFRDGNARCSDKLLNVVAGGGPSAAASKSLEEKRQGAGATPARPHLEKPEFGFQPRIHLPYKLGEAAPSPPKRRVVYEPPPVGIRMPDTKIQTQQLRRTIRVDDKLLLGDGTIGLARRSIQLRGDMLRARTEMLQTRRPVRREGSGSSRRSSSFPVDRVSVSADAAVRVAADPFLAMLPNELLLGVCDFLTPSENFRVCLAGSRVVPSVWGVALHLFHRRLAQVQRECEELQVLTDIASNSHGKAQETLQEYVTIRRMAQEDFARYGDDVPRFDREVGEVLELEADKMHQFQAAVVVLQNVMKSWTDRCKQRDEEQQRCLGLHQAISVAFSLAPAASKK